MEMHLLSDAISDVHALFLNFQQFIAFIEFSEPFRESIVIYTAHCCCFFGMHHFFLYQGNNIWIRIYFVGNNLQFTYIYLLQTMCISKKLDSYPSYLDNYHSYHDSYSSYNDTCRIVTYHDCFSFSAFSLFSVHSCNI